MERDYIRDSAFSLCCNHNLPRPQPARLIVDRLRACTVWGWQEVQAGGSRRVEAAARFAAIGEHSTAGRAQFPKHEERKRKSSDWTHPGPERHEHSPVDMAVW